ncbi:hypothetical protein GCM10020000_43100 [Streptomyces olivoverticillatus]
MRLSELLGGNQAQISHIESGRWGVSAERVRRLAAFYSATDAKLIDALCGMAEERAKGWWEEYRGVLPAGFLNIAELEHHARFLRAYQTLTVPGIFQTSDYARTIFAGRIPALPAKELNARIEHRMKRRVIFLNAQPHRSLKPSSTRQLCMCCTEGAARPGTSYGSCWKCPSGPL